MNRLGLETLIRYSANFFALHEVANQIDMALYNEHISIDDSVALFEALHHKRVHLLACAEVQAHILNDLYDYYALCDDWGKAIAEDNEFNAKRAEYIDLAFKHYMICALWSSTDDNGNYFDENYDEDAIDDESACTQQVDLITPFIEGNWLTIQSTNQTAQKGAHKKLVHLPVA